jgi:hypothetical protein
MDGLELLIGVFQKLLDEIFLCLDDDFFSVVGALSFPVSEARHEFVVHWYYNKFYSQ